MVRSLVLGLAGALVLILIDLEGTLASIQAIVLEIAYLAEAGLAGAHVAVRGAGFADIELETELDNELRFHLNTNNLPPCRRRRRRLGRHRPGR